MITREEMLALEAKAEKHGISRLQLMENAGREAAKAIEQKFDVKGKRILVVSYHGNNGGDGFVVALHLSEKADVEVLFIGDESKLKPEAAENFKKIEQSDRIQFIGLDYIDFNDYDLIIDAILGTGSSGPLEYPLNTVVEFINSSRAMKISLDIPTGMDPDTGKSEVMVNADFVITFHDIKKGLADLKKKTLVVDIGIPKA